MARKLVSSGSSFEADIGYSRAVVDGDWIFVSGTTGFDDAVESGEVEHTPCLCPLAQTARAVFPQAAFLCGRHCGVEDGLMPGTR